MTSTDPAYSADQADGAILLHHASSMDGFSWFTGPDSAESLPSKLIKEGFDVWLSNDRGTRNSQRHKTLDPVKDAEKFFDYSWAEIGTNDIPANLNYVKDHASGKQVVFLGFGEGATAILYALSKTDKALYFKHFLDDVVLMAPCLYLDPPMFKHEGMEPVSMAEGLYRSYEMIFDRYEQVGVHVYNGPSKEADARKLCHIFGKRNPECLRTQNPAGYGQPFSVKMQKHSQQNMIEGRFQEYSDTYAKYGVKNTNRARKTDKIDLTDVENIAPIHIFLAGDDLVCPVNVFSLLEQFKYPQPPVHTYEDWSHNDFVTGEHLDRLVTDIKKVTLERRRKEGDQQFKDLYQEL